MTSMERRVRDLHQLVVDQASLVESRLGALEKETRAGADLRARVLALERTVGKEQEECHRILQMILTLTREQ